MQHQGIMQLFKTKFLFLIRVNEAFYKLFEYLDETKLKAKLKPECRPLFAADPLADQPKPSHTNIYTQKQRYTCEYLQD